METQKFKSVNLRTLVTNAMQGKPINCHSVELFDIEPSDMDDNPTIITEYDDDLEVVQVVRDMARQKFYKSDDNNKDRKEVLDNETKDENASSQDAPQE